MNKLLRIAAIAVVVLALSAGTAFASVCSPVACASMKLMAVSIAGVHHTGTSVAARCGMKAEPKQRIATLEPKPDDAAVPAVAIVPSADADVELRALPVLGVALGPPPRATVLRI